MTPAEALALALPLPDWSETERRRVAARQIARLLDAGWRIVPVRVDLPELARLHGANETNETTRSAA